MMEILLIGFLPFVTALLLIATPQKLFQYSYQVSIISATICLIISTKQLMDFDLYNEGFQKIVFIYHFLNFNVTYSLGFDGISIWFVFLNSLLTFISLIYVSKYTINNKLFLILIFFIQFFVNQSFLVLDLFMFYIYFEAILIPMFLLIGVWGSYDRNLHAALLFFLYTLVGSLIMLLAIQYIQLEIGSTYFETMYTYSFSKSTQIFLFIAFFIAFAVKIPMFPVHVWLPEAHGEAPTVGSMILAGILLKLGVYGFIRIVLPVCSLAIDLFAPLIYLVAILGVLYTAFSTVIQTDIKRVIAYSSVGHMNLSVLGLFAGTNIGLDGAIFSSISHGFISPGLFMAVGVLYDRYGTKLISYYGSLSVYMPILATCTFLLSLANLAFPGTSAFVGEILIFTGLMSSNLILFFISSISVILVAIYTFWLFNRIFFGSNVPQGLIKFTDLTVDEILCFSILLIFVFIFGIYPTLILDILQISTTKII